MKREKNKYKEEYGMRSSFLLSFARAYFEIFRPKTLLILSISCVLMALSLVLLFHLTQYTDNGQVVEKGPLKAQLSTVIKNGGQLELVKHVYDVRELEHIRMFKTPNMKLYYSENTPLSSILNDLSVEYFTAEPFKNDSVYYSRLSSIIEDNQIHNPFDNLEDIQSNYFDNLRIKAGDNYDIVKDDVEQIALELNQKNQLVTKYLNKSNSSFVISIIALGLSLIMAITQTFQNGRLSKMIEPISKFADKKEE